MSIVVRQRAAGPTRVPVSAVRARKLWTVPDIWRGGECFILGGGPSLDQASVDRLKGRRVLAVTKQYELAPWADVLFWGDQPFYPGNKAAIDAFAGLKVTTHEAFVDTPGIKVVYRKNSETGVSRDTAMLFWNHSSGACAIGLARHFGVKRIVLLGFDMRKVDGRNNWHTKYADRGVKHNPYPTFLLSFPKIAEDLKAEGIECLNATPGSLLDVFPKVTLEKALA